MFEYDGEVNLENALTKEVSEYKWMFPDEINTLFRKNKFVPTLEYFFSKIYPLEKSNPIRIDIKFLKDFYRENPYGIRYITALLKEGNSHDEAFLFKYLVFKKGFKEPTRSIYEDYPIIRNLTDFSEQEILDEIDNLISEIYKNHTEIFKIDIFRDLI